MSPVQSQPKLHSNFQDNLSPGIKRLHRAKKPRAALRSSWANGVQGGLDRGAPLERVLGEMRARSQCTGGCSLQALLFCFFLTTDMEGSHPILQMGKTSLTAARSPVQAPIACLLVDPSCGLRPPGFKADCFWTPLHHPLSPFSAIFRNPPSFPLPLLWRAKDGLGEQDPAISNPMPWI